MRESDAETEAAHPDDPDRHRSLQRVDPDYLGGSILNLVAGIARHFGVATPHPGPSAHLPLTGVTAVVLLIVDALGYYQFERHLSTGCAPHLESFLRRGEATTAIATSTFPTTTATALTTLHTATAPAEHGMLGYTTWLTDVGAVVNMIHFRNLERDEPIDEPRLVMRKPTLYQQLGPLGVTCRVVLPAAFRASPFSALLCAGAEYLPYETPGTLPSRVAAALAGSGSRYVVAYWPGYDAVCHLHGPASPEADDELAMVDLALGRLIQAIPRTGRTLLVLAADHGQRDLDPAQAIILNDDPALVSRLSSPPMGERCGRYLRVHLREESWVAEHLRPVAEVVPMQDVWAMGLFGGPPADPEFRMRTGDLLAVPRGHRQLHWAFSSADRARIHRGGHGGWSAAEMLVPVIALRL